jgi:hypothetical protein
VKRRQAVTKSHVSRSTLRNLPRCATLLGVHEGRASEELFQHVGKRTHCGAKIISVLRRRKRSRTGPMRSGSRPSTNIAACSSPLRIACWGAWPMPRICCKRRLSAGSRPPTMIFALRGHFLVTVVTRLCINQLQSARVQREEYVGEWLPEPLITDPKSDPLGLLKIDESLSRRSFCCRSA